MDAANAIRYFRRQELDDTKWNACIDAATNGRIYAYSFYLDCMAGQWHALVLGDYEAVMPLTWRNKWSVYYLYQPAFCAQLGVFGKTVTPALVEQFLRAVPSRYQYWDFYGNQQNLLATADFPANRRVNYVLPLQHPYDTLAKQYRENIRRNIRKAKSYGCVVDRATPVEAILELAKAQPQQGDTKGDAFERFQKLHDILQEKGMVKNYGIRSDKGELLASAVFTFSHQRAYYILVGNHPNGRTLGASHLLIDAFIEDHAGTERMLDFEGSDIRNLAFFYSSFGAVEEHYPAFHLNRLPFWIKWLKK